MAFKGTARIGTRDARREAALLDALDEGVLRMACRSDLSSATRDHQALYMLRILLQPALAVAAAQLLTLPVCRLLL